MQNLPSKNISFVGRCRTAFTIVEVLVVIGIVSVLLAITIPAVQSARESSRRTLCLNNLRQLGVAAANWESAHKAYPNSWFYDLMPLLDQNSLRDFIVADRPGEQVPVPDSFLRCPSDNGALTYSGSGVVTIHNFNYVGNHGVNRMFPELFGPITYGFSDDKKIDIGMIRDGTSNTCLFSETFAGTERLRCVWKLPGPGYNVDEFDALCSVGELIPKNPIQYGWVGDTTLKGEMIYTLESGDARLTGGVAGSLHNHSLTPNQPAYENGSVLMTGVFPPSSAHYSIVNATFCDGHVETISDSIDLMVWRSMGSCNQVGNSIGF